MENIYYKELGSAYLAHYARRLSDLINEQSNALMKQLNLITPPSSVSTICYIHQHQPITVAQLADALAVTHQMASQRINALIKLNLIERQPSAHDQRAKVIKLTTLGQREIKQLKSFTQQMDQVFEALEQEINHPLSQLILTTEDRLRNNNLSNRFHSQQQKS